MRGSYGVALGQEQRFTQEKTQLQQRERELTSYTRTMEASGNPNDDERYRKAQQELLSIQERLVQVTERLGEVKERRAHAGLQLAEKESAVRKTEIDLLRQRHDLAREDTARSRSSTEGIGFLKHGERTWARQAVEQAQKFGLEGLTLDQVSSIRQVGGDRFLSKMAVEEAGRDPETKRIQQLLGLKDLGAAGKAEMELKHKVEVAVELDMKKGFEAEAKKFSPEQRAEAKAIALEAAEAKIRKLREEFLQQWGGQR